MRIEMRSAAARRLATELYPGDSPPLSREYPGDRPLDIEWWRSNPQPESSGSLRHSTALRLYLAIARNSRTSLPEDCFPASFDFDDCSMRPDKGVMKVFLDEGLLEPRMMGSQLIFDLSQLGRDYLTSRP